MTFTEKIIAHHSKSMSNKGKIKSQYFIYNYIHLCAVQLDAW